MMSQRQNFSRRLVRFCWLCMAACALGVGSIHAQSVVLQLRNGDRLTGTILAEETNKVTFKTTWWNVVVIPTEQIKSREVLPAAAPGPDAGLAKPAPAAPPTPTQVVAKSPTPPGQPKAVKQWAGEALVGTDLLFSETRRQLYTGKLKATYTHSRLRNILDYSFSYGTTDGELSDNRMYGTAKTDYDLIGYLYVYNLMGAGYDEIRKIDLRYEIGPGLGYHLIKRTNYVLNIEAGVNYQEEDLEDGLVRESLFYRFAEDFTWRINSRFSFDEKFEYFPQVGNWGEYRFRFEGNVRFALKSNLSLVLTVLDQYETEPAPGVGQNDLQIRSSVGLKF
jgi:putative salt-induced outer membrane protein